MNRSGKEREEKEAKFVSKNSIHVCTRIYMCMSSVFIRCGCVGEME